MPSVKKMIFVAMPFKAEYDGVLAVAKDAAALLNAELIHLGEQAYTGSITTKICNSIDEADALIAVASEENGNVYYEIGIAHCQRKPVAILTSDASSLKFDLRDHRALVYDPANPQAIRDDLVKTLAVVLTAPLDKTQYLASAFRGVSTNPTTAYREGLQKALDTVSAQLNLTEPCVVMSVNYQPEKREIAFELKDFMGVRARAFVDVNGIVRSIKRMSR